MANKIPKVGNTIGTLILTSTYESQETPHAKATETAGQNTGPQTEEGRKGGHCAYRTLEKVESGEVVRPSFTFVGFTLNRITLFAPPPGRRDRMLLASVG